MTCAQSGIGRCLSRSTIRSQELKRDPVSGNLQVPVGITRSECNALSRCEQNQRQRKSRDRQRTAFRICILSSSPSLLLSPLPVLNSCFSSLSHQRTRLSISILESIALFNIVTLQPHQERPATRGVGQTRLNNVRTTYHVLRPVTPGTGCRYQTANPRNLTRE